MEWKKKYNKIAEFFFWILQNGWESILCGESNIIYDHAATELETLFVLDLRGLMPDGTRFSRLIRALWFNGDDLGDE